MLFNVVVTTYNSGLTIRKTINSINALLNVYNRSDFRVLFIDDCSIDNTISIINRFSQFHYEVYINEKNHGNPTKSRNKGIDMANGEYIIFFDADDEFIIEGLVEALSIAKAGNYDLVRTALIRRESDNEILLNNINLEAKNLKNEIINTSLITPAIIKWQFLKKTGIRFYENQKFSEDAIFYLELLYETDNIGYSNSPLYYYNNYGSASVTANYNEDGIKSHIEAFSRLEVLYSNLGIDYKKTRGNVAIRVQLEQIYRNKLSDISFEVFESLSKFYSNTKYNFEDKKINSLYGCIKELDFETYKTLLKKTILIAGYDLKFIKPFYGKISEKYNLLVDEWHGHDFTDFNKSKEMLEKADIIFCEWLLGNVEWYTQNKKDNQKLIVRAHRFDLYRENWKNVNFEKVDHLITVSPFFYYYAASNYPIDKYKIVCIPNELRIQDYLKRDKIYYNIALVGFVPMRKGLMEALEVLKKVRSNGIDIKLNLYGKDFYEIGWLKKIQEEEKYYLDCLNYIKENELEDFVIFNGFVDLKKELCKNDIVLSVSNSESFHIGLAEAFVVNSVGLLLNWDGSEYIYPPHLISESTKEMANKIIDCYNNDMFEEYIQVSAETINKYNLSIVEGKLLSILDR